MYIFFRYLTFMISLFSLFYLLNSWRCLLINCFNIVIYNNTNLSDYLKKADNLLSLKRFNTCFFSLKYIEYNLFFVGF